ncbi:unnamed protein product, partial [Discosporangium mesarthrocarpum]
FLYPRESQSDLIQRFHHDDMFAEHLAIVFPEEGPRSPWDQNFEYRCSRLEVYFEIAPVQASPSVFDWVADFENLQAVKAGRGGGRANHEGLTKRG